MRRNDDRVGRTPSPLNAPTDPYQFYRNREDPCVAVHVGPQATQAQWYCRLMPEQDERLCPAARVSTLEAVVQGLTIRSARTLTIEIKLKP